MGPELDVKPKSEASMKASVQKENTSLHQDPRDEFLPCVSNYKDETFDVEASLVVKQTTPPDMTENEELNITDTTHSPNIDVVQTDYIDEIENSSSFGDTVSGAEEDSVLNGDEAQSRLHGDHASVSTYDAYFGEFRMRKKKLTAHWRKFVRPLMWRCKWMELQIKELQSQAMKYDKELAEFSERKEFEFGRFALEGLDAKSLPFLSQSGRNKVMKRKKRKRVEEVVDVVSYMSQHNLFSYYENNKSVPDIASVHDDFGNLGKTTYPNDELGTNDGFSFEFQDGDSSFEDLFQKIETIQSRVRELISRAEKVVSGNLGNTSSINRSSRVATLNAPVSTAQNPAAPESGNGLQVDSLCIATQRASSERNMGDLLMLESAVSSHGEVTPHSETIGSTDQLQVGHLLANTEDEVLIDNEHAKEELHDFEKLRDQLVEKPQVSEEKKQEKPSLLVSEAATTSKAVVGSNMKTRYGGKRKPALRR
ncbi:uncharacterized protein LOC21404668 isoform X1 [Morus notabilis]|nr:uncharacterized protein LOC21404668 isoform X1 [Morus notabilis]